MERHRENVTERVRERERERLRASTTFQSVSGFALPSMLHNNLPLHPIFGTSATALCGTMLYIIMLKQFSVAQWSLRFPEFLGEIMVKSTVFPGKIPPLQLSGAAGGSTGSVTFSNFSISCSWKPWQGDPGSGYSPVETDRENGYYFLRTRIHFLCVEIQKTHTYSMDFIGFPWKCREKT